MSYVIARVIKVKSTAIGAMQYHNDRAPGGVLNPDIDPERTHLNYELHDAEGCYLPRKYAAEVDAKIAANRASGRKVRKDAVKLVEGIITASPEFFEGKSRRSAAASSRTHTSSSRPRWARRTSFTSPSHGRDHAARALGRGSHQGRTALVEGVL